MSRIATASTGIVNATATKNRRRMSVSSGDSPSARSGATGSRAMPHFGQAPGASRTISGCIGHV